MSSEIVLYDLACRGRCACWSPNVWKVRLALNYKSIPYHTEWVTQANIGDKLKNLVEEPNPTGLPYTVPTVVFTDGTVIMDSDKIVEKLETIYPNPPLRRDADLLEKATSILRNASHPLLPVFMPRIWREKVVESSMPVFYESRSKAFGMPLEEFERTKGGESAWQAAEPKFQELAAFLKENKVTDGPFILGNQVSYADFAIVAVMVALKCIGSDAYDRVFTRDESFNNLYEACGKWMEKDQ